MLKPALLGAAVLLLLNLLALAASMYGDFAERGLDRLPDDSVDRAGVLAGTLAPWLAPHHARRGWIAAESGDFPAADAAYLKALRRAPADALLWAEYALALARNRMFDARLLLATRRALALAPTSPAVRQAISRMALTYWRFGSAELRGLWQQALRWELDHNRTAFLQSVDRDGYRRAFCLDQAEAFNEQDWCRGAAP